MLSLVKEDGEKEMLVIQASEEQSVFLRRLGKDDPKKAKVKPPPPHPLPPVPPHAQCLGKTPFI